MAGDRRFTSPRLLRQSKTSQSWPNKWTALVVVVIASVLLLFQTEISVFSIPASSVSKTERPISYYKHEMKKSPPSDVIAENRRVVEELDEPHNVPNVTDKVEESASSDTPRKEQHTALETANESKSESITNPSSDASSGTTDKGSESSEPKQKTTEAEASEDTSDEDEIDSKDLPKTNGTADGGEGDFVTLKPEDREDADDSGKDEEDSSEENNADEEDAKKNNGGNDDGKTTNQQGKPSNEDKADTEDNADEDEQGHKEESSVESKNSEKALIGDKSQKAENSGSKVEGKVVKMQNAVEDEVDESGEEKDDSGKDSGKSDDKDGELEGEKENVKSEDKTVESQSEGNDEEAEKDEDKIEDKTSLKEKSEEQKSGEEDKEGASGEGTQEESNSQEETTKEEEKNENNEGKTNEEMKEPARSGKYQAEVKDSEEGNSEKVKGNLKKFEDGESDKVSDGEDTFESNSTSGYVFQEGVDPGREKRLTRFNRCYGRYVYIYDLPPRFNADYVANCKHIHKTVNFCKAFSNAGMGRPARVKRSKTGPLELVPRGTWFESDQFSLEITFHARMLQYPCLTKNPDRATVFYVPFFAGLAIFRSLYEPDQEEKDKDAKLVLAWLEKLPYWHKHHGRDHLFVFTRVLIDFTRGMVHDHWGNTFMLMSHMTNATVLTIEAPYHRKLKNAISVPYPTSFHPATDEHVREWQQFVRQFHRKYRIAFGGVGHGFGANIRKQLKELCLGAKSPTCRLFHCGNRVCFRPHNVIWHYMKAHFCFQPPGDTPTRKGMFDCMLAGGIPVLFHEHTAFRYFWHLPKDHTQYSVFQPRQQFWKDNGTSILEKVKSFSMEEIERLRDNVIDLIPSLVYAMPGEYLSSFRDAFQISVEKVVQRVSKLQLPEHARLPKSDWQ